MKTSILKLFLTLITLTIAVLANAQWSPPPPTDTVDLPAANSPIIVTGTLQDAKADPNDKWSWVITVYVEESLKGTFPVGHPATFKIRRLFKNEEIQSWKSKESLLLISAGEDGFNSGRVIDLSSKDLAVFTSDLKLLRKDKEVLQEVRDEIRATQKLPMKGRFERFAPASIVAGTPFEKITWVNQDKRVRFYVPLDQRLEQFGRMEIKGKTPDVRIGGILALQNFKTEENIGLLKELLKDNGWYETWAIVGNRTYARRQNDVRHYAYEALTTMGVKVEAPVESEPRDRHLQVISAETDPKTDLVTQLDDLARCSNLADLSLMNVQLNPGTVEYLVRIKSITMLYLEGTNLDGTMLEQLAELPNLDYLNLANTPIADADLPILAKLKALKRVDLDPLISDKAIASLKKVRPDITVLPDDLKFLQSLHPRREDTGFSGRSVHKADSSTPGVWRYCLVFPKNAASQLKELLETNLLAKGWTAKPPENGMKFYERLRDPVKGPDGGILHDTVTLPDPITPEVEGWAGVQLRSGETFVIVERTIKYP